MSVALITGASSGLGLEFARLFASDGVSLILAARRKDVLEQVAAELRADHPSIRVHIFAVDLATPGAGQTLYDQVLAQNLTVDFLVNNAGFGNTGEFSKLPLAKELQMLDLNIRTLVELTHLFLPAMLARRSGRILNIGSTAGFQPGPFMAGYYASKAFVNSFSEALHEELKDTGVSCTVLAPGATATDFARASGSANTRLFKSGNVADSKTVARLGYRSMLAGRAVAVPGLINNSMVQMLRFSPRSLVRKITSLTNRPSGAGTGP
jgi:short-subunit dehydrogenase